MPSTRPLHRTLFCEKYAPTLFAILLPRLVDFLVPINEIIGLLRRVRFPNKYSIAGGLLSSLSLDG